MADVMDVMWNNCFKNILTMLEWKVWHADTFCQVSSNTFHYCILFIDWCFNWFSDVYPIVDFFSPGFLKVLTLDFSVCFFSPSAVRFPESHNISTSTYLEQGASLPLRMRTFSLPAARSSWDIIRAPRGAGRGSVCRTEPEHGREDARLHGGDGGEDEEEERGQQLW